MLLKILCHLTDIYELSSSLLKKVIDCITEPLSYCIKECLVDGVFPVVLKLSTVVPIYKKDETDCLAVIDKSP